ncbi:MAG: T9SS type A sorting domain-containing protein, partial [Saprospiraceae bacterium]|nr:T9SS type A sorting domain-containing protein [Saprospiraceae bacterium]
IDISTIGGQQLLPLGTDTLTTFHFLNDVSKESIAICTLNTAQNTVTNVQYKVVSSATATESPLSFEQLETYPNPAQNFLYVRLPGDETGSNFQLILINTEGKQVLAQQAPSGTTEREVHIPVSHLASGVYTLLLQRNGMVTGSAKVVKGGD